MCLRDRCACSGHSRVPVFHSGNRRNVMGLLLVKRLLPVSPADNRKVGEFVFRQPIVIDPLVSLLDCLNIFQSNRTHMAFISPHTAEFDSFLKKSAAAIAMGSGAVTDADYQLFPTMSPIVEIAGLLTVEDVMEHLIGEDIDDETDTNTSARDQLNKAFSGESTGGVPSLGGTTSGVLTDERPNVGSRLVRLRELARQSVQLNRALGGMQGRTASINRAQATTQSSSRALGALLAAEHDVDDATGVRGQIPKQQPTAEGDVERGAMPSSDRVANEAGKSETAPLLASSPEEKLAEKAVWKSREPPPGWTPVKTEPGDDKSVQ